MHHSPLSPVSCLVISTLKEHQRVAYRLPIANNCSRRTICIGKPVSFPTHLMPLLQTHQRTQLLLEDVCAISNFLNTPLGLYFCKSAPDVPTNQTAFPHQMKAYLPLPSMGQWVETDPGFAHDALPVKCLLMPNFGRTLASLSLFPSLSCFHLHFIFFFLKIQGFRILRHKEVKQCYLSIVVQITQMVKLKMELSWNSILSLSESQNHELPTIYPTPQMLRSLILFHKLS